MSSKVKKVLKPVEASAESTPISPIEAAKIKLLAFYEQANPGWLFEDAKKLGIDYDLMCVAWHKLSDEKKVPVSFSKPDVPKRV